MKINTIYFIILIVFILTLVHFGSGFWETNVLISILLTVFAFILSVICINGIKRIELNELGVVLLFAKPVYSVVSGVVLVPSPYEIIRESKSIIEFKFPDDKSENEKPTPILITHGTSKDGLARPLRHRQITPVSIIVRFKIADLFRYVREFGGYDYHVFTDELRKQIREVVVSATMEECRGHTLDENLERQGDIDGILKLAVKNLSKDYGVEIITARIEQFDLEDIGTAFREVAVTEIQKDVVISKAEAEKQKRILEGEGASEALRLLKFAKTKGLKEMANELNITDVEALYKIDALVEAIKANRSTDISLIGEDVGDVVKILTTLKSIEQKQG